MEIKRTELIGPRDLQVRQGSFFALGGLSVGSHMGLAISAAQAVYQRTQLPSIPRTILASTLRTTGYCAIAGVALAGSPWGAYDKDWEVRPQAERTWAVEYGLRSRHEWTVRSMVFGAGLALGKGFRGARVVGAAGIGASAGHWMGTLILNHWNWD